MRIEHTDFGPIWAASGTLGFFGEGYWYHRAYRLIPGFSTKGLSFVAKTVTNEALAGNMPLHHNWTPKEYFPKSIWFDVASGNGLNAIGLSNHGIITALETGLWQKMREPLMLSWMPRAGFDAVEETKLFVQKLGTHLQQFSAPVALQVNLSCPNTEEDLSALTKEAVAILTILEHLGIPLIPKFNVTTSPEAVADIASKARVDGIVMSNTIPFETRELGIHWKEFGSQSPLKRRGLKQDGGLSGSTLFPIVKRWVLKAEKPLAGLSINFCGGVDSAKRVKEALSLPNVQSVSVATAMMVRPWRMHSIIASAYKTRR